MLPRRAQRTRSSGRMGQGQIRLAASRSPRLGGEYQSMTAGLVPATVRANPSANPSNASNLTNSFFYRGGRRGARRTESWNAFLSANLRILSGFILPARASASANRSKASNLTSNPAANASNLASNPAANPYSPSKFSPPCLEGLFPSHRKAGRGKLCGRRMEGWLVSRLAGLGGNTHRPATNANPQRSRRFLEDVRAGAMRFGSLTNPQTKTTARVRLSIRTSTNQSQRVFAAEPLPLRWSS